MRRARMITSALALLLLAGCVTKTEVLTNDKGETDTCKVKGRVGVVSGLVLEHRFKECIEKAKARGFREPADKAAG
jgi:hypothetical protein